MLRTLCSGNKTSSVISLTGEKAKWSHCKNENNLYHVFDYRWCLSHSITGAWRPSEIPKMHFSSTEQSWRFSLSSMCLSVDQNTSAFFIWCQKSGAGRQNTITYLVLAFSLRTRVKYGFKGTKESHSWLQAEVRCITKRFLSILRTASKNMLNWTLYRYRTFPEIGLPYQNIKKHSFALLRFLLSLSNYIAQFALILTPNQVALTTVTISHNMVIWKKKKLHLTQ